MPNSSVRARRTKFVFTFLLAVGVILSCLSLVYAQVLTGTITGLVTDPSDAVIPGAKVKIVDLATAREYQAATDNAGSFTVTNLPFGFYSVTVEVQGFSKFTVPRVQVNVAQTAKVIAKLELAKTGSEVVVLSEQTVIETESAEIKGSVDRRQIMLLPLPTRNPLDLVRTMPGIVTPTTSGIADAFVHGLRGNSTNITQDGINVADNFVKTSSFFAISAPTVDTTGEFNVSIGGIGVDAGFGAAQVNIRTQRGGNDFHGSVFWFQRTNALNANVWFNNAANVPRPFQLQQRIGVSAGGPVYLPKVYDGRNRTWLFGTYEAFREPLSRSRTRTVLTSSARQGLFTYTPTCTAATCPPGVTPGQPRTINLLAPGVGQIGNTGLPVQINQDVMNFYNALVPDPNTDAGCTSDGVNIRCFTFNLPGKSIQDRYTLRADHQLTKNHAIEFVFNQADFSSIPDLLNGIEPNFPKATGGGQLSRRQVLTWGFHSTFGTTMTNEARFGYQRAPVSFDLFEQYGDTGGFQLDVPRVTDPTITQGNLPQGRNTPVRQLTDNFAWVKGKHAFRFGAEYRQVVANSFFFNTVVPRVFIASTTNVTNPSNPNGITPSDFPGGISSGDLGRAQDVFNITTGLLGSIQQGFNHTSPTSGFVPGVPRTINPLQHNFAAYFQDNFKLRSNLSLTYGVRYEYQGVFDLRNGLVLQPTDGVAGLFGPAGVGNFFNPLTTPALNDTLLDFAGGNNGRPLYQRDLNNFAPFLGFAWDPWSNGKTSIRGGATVHYTQDGFTLFQLSGTGNAGLFTVRTNTTPTGVFSNSSNPAPTAPTASFPVSERANFTASNLQNLWVFDPNLSTPYVIEWHLSVARELWKRVTIEGRYVGNHAVRLFRSWDINELNLTNNPFTFGGNSVANAFTEFQHAQSNLTVCQNNSAACTAAQGAAGVPASQRSANNFGNWGLAGQVPLPIFSAVFQGLSQGSGFGNSGFVTNLGENQIGRLYDTIRRLNTFQANRETNFPLNFFVPNPFANSAILVDNSSWSYYHGMELEVRRRFSTGIFLSANYTLGKVLTDTRFLTDQQEFQTFRSVLNRGLDKNRAAFDVRHSFSANFIYQLPFGRGQWLGSNVHPVLDKFIGGWNVQGFTRWSTGAPITISSGRVTTGAFIGEPAVVRNMTPSELMQQSGVFRTPNGVFWLNPDSGLLTVSGSTSRAVFCTPGQTTPCFDHPGADQNGSLPFFGFDSPRFFDQDFGIIKRTSFPSISETLSFDIRFEFFNAFNNPNFGGISNGIDNSNFGQLTSIVDTVRGGGVTSRIIQWALRVNW